MGENDTLARSKLTKTAHLACAFILFLPHNTRVIFFFRY